MEVVVCPHICQFSSEITLDIVLYDLQLNFVQNKSLSGYAQLARFKASDDVPLQATGDQDLEWRELVEW